MRDKGDKVFKGGLSKFCGKRPLKNLKQTISLQFFKGCLPQNLLSPLLNTLSQVRLFNHGIKKKKCGISACNGALFD